MDQTRRTATLVGVLFVIATVVLIVSGVFSVSITSPEYLTDIATNETNVLTGALLEIISAAAIIGIPLTIYPILKKHNESLALGYFSARLFEGLFIIFGTIILLMLLSLSQEFVATANTAGTSFQVSGNLLLSARDWSSILLDIPFTVGAIILNYVFYKSMLIPRWLSTWGIIGATLWFTVALLHLFGFNPPLSEILALPIAAQEMTLAVLLIVKGFNLEVIKS